MNHQVKVFAYKSEGLGFKLTQVASYSTQGETCEDVCEEAFHIFNAPESILSEFQLHVLGNYHKINPSLSVGDYVQVSAFNMPGVFKTFQCQSVGWEEIDNGLPDLNKLYSREEYLQARLGELAKEA